MAGLNNLTISKGGDLFRDLSNRPIFNLGNTVFSLFVIQEFLFLIFGLGLLIPFHFFFLDYH